MFADGSVQSPPGKAAGSSVAGACEVEAEDFREVIGAERGQGLPRGRAHVRNRGK